MAIRHSKVLRLLLFAQVGAILLTGCNRGDTPKPRGYYRIEFPKKEYRLLDTIYPYKFMYPVYGRVIPDTHRDAHKYWTNVDFPQFKARIHLSYYNSPHLLDSLMEDSRTLAYKHTVRADAIAERFYSNTQNRVYGILYQIKGNAASSWQFFVTDSVRHFLRGALYFSVTPNKDSLQPVSQFFQEDMVKLIETLEWKDIK